MAIFRTFAAAVAIGVVGICAGAGADALMRGRQTPAAERVAVAIGDLRIAVPSDYVRAGASAGGAERIDLVLSLPDMAPAGDPRARGAANRALVFLAIGRMDGGIDPADRAQDLYGRFLEPDAWRNPGGLVLRRFEAGSPYEDEELYVAPPDGRAFAARCRKAVKGMESIGESCLWRFRRNGADVQVRFRPDLLPQWEALIGGLAAKFDEWGAARRGS